jgi:four helix bundle protein
MIVSRSISQSSQLPLPHERLDVFAVAVELTELCAGIRPHRGAAELCEQLRRAASSVALNIAEACGKSGRDRLRYFEIARGSATESAAALRVMLALGVICPAVHERGRALCGRLYAMLTRLVRPAARPGGPP